MAKLADKGLTEEQRKRQESWAALRARSSILPHAFGEYLADVRQMLPDFTAHNAIPTFWLGNSQSYVPAAYATLTHRDSVDYTDYCLPPWGNFRAPAFLAMNNPLRQKLQCEFFTHNARSEQFASAFGAAGRGLDGFSMTSASEDLLRIFQRYGAWFSAHDPLPDVAVYFSGWPNQASVILHDLARMRRPGMLVSPEDVLAGELARHKVLSSRASGPVNRPRFSPPSASSKNAAAWSSRTPCVTRACPAGRSALATTRTRSTTAGGWRIRTANGSSPISGKISRRPASSR